MHNKVKIIYKDPLGLILSLVMGRFQTQTLIYTPQHILAQCLGMCGGGGGTDNESVKERLLLAISKTDFRDVVSLDLLQRIDDNLRQSEFTFFFNFLFFNYLLINWHKNNFLQKYPFFQPFSCYFCKVFYAVLQ